MKPERHILVFVDWYLPGYKAGGPIRSVANLVKVLGKDFQFSIVTSNSDFGSVTPYTEVPSDQWVEQEGARVIYLSPENRNRRYFQQLIAACNADVLYFNSFFSYRFTLLPLLALKLKRMRHKVVLAPRGMLGEGALKIKALKKHAFIRIAKAMGLYDEVTWHASTALEETEIKRIFGNRSKVVVARNIALPDVSADARSYEKKPGEARFFFLSRIALKKNLKAAINWINKTKTGHAVQFDIYGPVDEAAYWNECQALIQNTERIHIQYKGELPYHQVGPTLQHYHFLLLPTFNENYGHVIVESFVNGCPVVISDQTPWRGLQAKNIGWEFSLAEETNFLQVLENCIEMDEPTFQKMSEAATAFGREAMCPPADVECNRLLFKNA